MSGLVSSGVRVVLCVGHNRGWEEAASELAGGASVTLRTANAAVLDCAAPSWQEATETGFSGWTLRGVLAP